MSVIMALTLPSDHGLIQSLAIHTSTMIDGLPVPLVSAKCDLSCWIHLSKSSAKRSTCWTPKACTCCWRNSNAPASCSSAVPSQAQGFSGSRISNTLMIASCSLVLEGLTLLLLVCGSCQRCNLNAAPIPPPPLPGRCVRNDIFSMRLTRTPSCLKKSAQLLRAKCPPSWSAPRCHRDRCPDRGGMSAQLCTHAYIYIYIYIYGIHTCTHQHRHIRHI